MRTGKKKVIIGTKLEEKDAKKLKDLANKYYDGYVSILVRKIILEWLEKNGV
jgi:predicted kinase